ncbi:MAG TPA: Sjogren's syndrome/scleroderma autoantigen 1 family protein [Nitrososphaeraceae archaeon]|jgi:hypothetical protein
MPSGGHDENPDSGLKSAADSLTKGGILVREPCDVCNGVQVKFRDQLRCVNCGRVTYENKLEPIPTVHKTNGSKEIIKDIDSSSPFHLQFEKIFVPSIERRIMELIQEIKNDNSILEEIAKARLIDTYLSILNRFRKVRNPK